MISPIHWTYNESKMIKVSICCYIRRSKLNTLRTGDADLCF